MYHVVAWHVNYDMFRSDSKTVDTFKITHKHISINEKQPNAGFYTFKHYFYTTKIDYEWLKACIRVT